jgi:hypothetical protein
MMAARKRESVTAGLSVPERVLLSVLQWGTDSNLIRKFN